jgi:membrane protease YdiL (CAAX protease family)
MSSSIVVRTPADASNSITRPTIALFLLAGALCVRLLLEGWQPSAGFVAGAAFGGLLIVGSRRLGWSVQRPPTLALLLGLLGGVLLVALPRALRPETALFVGMRPQPFVVWVAVTVAVAVGEEVLLRGVLFDATNAAAGPWAAVALTSVAFALLHVPLYGWAVVPLDLAVGVCLAGLKLVTGSVAAPAVAHVVADLATWL